MWDASLVIPKFIVPPHPNLVKTLEKIWKCTLKFMAPRILWKGFILDPLLTWPTQVSNQFSVGGGTQIYKRWTSNGGKKLGWFFNRWQYHSFFSYNAREAITENWSDLLDETDSIQKRKRLEKYVQKLCTFTGECVYCSIRRLSTTETEMSTSWGCD